MNPFKTVARPELQPVKRVDLAVEPTEGPDELAHRRHLAAQVFATAL